MLAYNFSQIFTEIKLNSIVISNRICMQVAQDISSAK